MYMSQSTQPVPRPIQFDHETIFFQYCSEDGQVVLKCLTPAFFAEILNLVIIKSKPVANHSVIFRFRDVDVDVNHFLKNSRIESRTNEEGVISLWFCHGASSTQFFDRMFADLIRVDNTKCECVFNDSVREQNVRDALNHYIATGELIRTLGSRSAEFDQINDLIVNFNTSSWMLSEIKRSNGLDPKKIFIAVIAPSFTGKTQLAFSVIDKKPLYFVLNLKKDPQLIYQNYSSISEKLIEFAREDLLKIIPRISLKNITKFKLLLNHSNIKFKSLGFLFALMIESNEKFGVGDAAAVPWMEFFADRRIGDRLQMQFQSKSINDCRNDPRFLLLTQQYFLFLDEFPAKRFSAFLRNLCCALEFTCVVASTDTDVVYLVGKKSPPGCRLAENTIWCAVVSRLPLLTAGFEDDFVRVKLRLQVMAESVRFPEESAKMFTFLSFFHSQLKRLRPGIAVKALAYLEEAADRFGSLRANLTFTVLDFVLVQLSVYVQKLKTKIDGTKAMIAHISLFSNASFNSNYAQVTHDSIRPSFIKNHLYYLSNPVMSVCKNMFLLWLSRSYEEVEDDPADLEFAPVTRLGVGKEETRFKSVFDSNEILLMLCLFLIKPRLTTSKIVLKCEVLSSEETVNSDRTTNSNMVVANSGPLLENIAVCSFIQSSHISSLNGSYGNSFLCEVIRNFIVDFGGRNSNSSIKLSYGRGIKPQIAKYHIPFLYTSNITCPPQLKALFNYGSFVLTSKTAQFDIFQDGTLAKAVIECMDYSRVIPLDKYIAIVKKGALQPGIKIHFTVCNSIDRESSGQNEQNINLLGDLADSQRYNIYRVARISGPPSYSFELVRFCPDFKYKINPTIIFIVLELNEINGI